MSTSPTRIAILGGGFGGLYTALRLSRLPWESSQQPEIVLVDRGDRFLFSPLLYEWISGEMQAWEIAPPFEELLAGTSIRFQQGHVAGIDFANRHVKLDGAPDLDYDRLVIALGSQTPALGIPGGKEFAIPFKTFDDAARLSEKLRRLERSDKETIRIAIVGGGYSGVELACKLADRLGKRGRLRLVERGETILATSSEFNRKNAYQALEKRRVWLDLETEVAEIEADALSLRYKGQVDRIPVDIVLWTVGNQAADPVRDLPLPQSNCGTIAVNEFLQAPERPEVYAIGDSAHCRDAAGKIVPSTAQVAFQQADYCAWNIWASLSDRPLLPFRYQEMGEMMALGTDEATIDGLGIKLDGLLAYLARRSVYLYRQPTWQHQLAVGLKWVADPLFTWLKA